MQNTTTTILALCITVSLVLIVPLGTMLSRNDNVTQEKVKLIIQESLAEVQNTGVITTEWYQNLKNRLAATGNTYAIDIEVHHLDENPGKKTAQANYTKIGENVYYIEYTTQVLKQIGIETDDEVGLANNKMLLGQGDKVYLGVKNTSTTGKQNYNSSLLGFSSEDEVAISASGSVMVTVNGSK